MNGRIGRVVGIGGAAFAFLAAGCASKPAANAAKTAPAAAAAPAPASTVAGDQKDFAPTGRDAAVESLPQDVVEINKRGYLGDTFFDFDRSDVRTDQRDVLSKDAGWLRKWPTVKVRIEGHCDERGTAQYNLALGERRAEADREYLASLGVDGKRMEVVSYGKEKPFAVGHDEQAWSQNRRDHFLVVAR
jgi:peptidoglycan-associated lipoprotein